MIKIVLNGRPMSWVAPYVGKRGSFSKRTPHLNRLRFAVKRQYSPDYPIDEAVICDVICYMPIPKGTSKKKTMAMLEGKIRPITRPDRTNIAKLSEDALNGIVIRDDSLIVGGKVEKWYCECPRVEMLISTLSSQMNQLTTDGQHSLLH